MHFHLEIIMPPTQDVASAVQKVMAKFSEPRDANDEDQNPHPFWDWYQLGGRYSGSKLEALVPEEKRKAFLVELRDLGITISRIVFGKEELEPASQSVAVDALWRERFPAAGDTCPMFKHSGDHLPMDVCTLAELPPGLRAHSVIVAAPDYQGQLAAAYMLHKSIWNGVTHQDTGFDGTVGAALSEHIKRLNHSSNEYKEKTMPRDDWLVVTVDYHS